MSTKKTINSSDYNKHDLPSEYNDALQRNSTNEVGQPQSYDELQDEMFNYYEHNFHQKCLEDWFQQKTECPVCRSAVVPELWR